MTNVFGAISHCVQLVTEDSMVLIIKIGASVVPIKTVGSKMNSNANVIVL
jgi:hypothetical protein